jgi:hypothetical protein
LSTKFILWHYILDVQVIKSLITATKHRFGPIQREPTVEDGLGEVGKMEGRIGKPGNLGNRVQQTEGRRQETEYRRQNTGRRTLSCLPKRQVPELFDNCRECSTNRPFLCKTKPISAKAENERKLSFDKGLCKNWRLRRSEKQSQTKPISTGTENEG